MWLIQKTVCMCMYITYKLWCVVGICSYCCSAGISCSWRRCKASTCGRWFWRRRSSRPGWHSRGVWTTSATVRITMKLYIYNSCRNISQSSVKKWKSCNDTITEVSVHLLLFFFDLWIRPYAAVHHRATTPTQQGKTFVATLSVPFQLKVASQLFIV